MEKALTKKTVIGVTRNVESGAIDDPRMQNQSTKLTYNKEQSESKIENIVETEHINKPNSLDKNEMATLNKGNFRKSKK